MERATTHRSPFPPSIAVQSCTRHVHACVPDICNQVFDALQLERCGVAVPTAPPPRRELPLPATALFVDYIQGSDEGIGTLSSPFKTVHRAVNASRATGGCKAIVLRRGTHFLSATLELGPADAGLTIQRYGSEEVWLSGGVPLSDWTDLKRDGLFAHPVHARAPARARAQARTRAGTGGRRRSLGAEFAHTRGGVLGMGRPMHAGTVSQPAITNMP